MGKTSYEAEKVRLGIEAVRAIHEGMPEADAALNNASRRVVSAMEETYGAAWLGHIERSGRKNGNALWRWNGFPVLNFEATFVVPVEDARLLELIEERNEAKYEGVKKDAVRVNAIFARVMELSGTILVWT